MFQKFALLAVLVAFVGAQSASAAAIDNELLQKVMRYEAQKAAAAEELAEIQKVIAEMNRAALPTIAPLLLATDGSSNSTSNSTSNGSSSNSTETATPSSMSTSSSASGGGFDIETPPVITEEPTTEPVETEAPTETPVPSPTSGAVANMQCVAPVAFAVAATAFTLF